MAINPKKSHLSDFSAGTQRPEIIAHQDFPIVSKFYRERGRVKNLVFFAIGSLAMFGSFLVLAQIHSGIASTQQILGTVSTGLEFLKSNSLSESRASFAAAREQLRASENIFIKIATNFPSANIERIFDATDAITEALENTEKAAVLLEESKIAWNLETNSSDQKFYTDLKQSRDLFIQAKLRIFEANRIIAEIPAGFLPEAYREKFEEGRANLQTAEVLLTEVTDLQRIILNLIGGEKKTYLLIFQNNNEARATGGFIGTYGLLELGNGIMQITKIESIYNLDGQLREQIAAPGPLQPLSTPYWGMRDANWFVDFPTSSRKILQFLEKEANILADGVISFTPDVFEEILKLTGPISMSEYDETLTSLNFREIVQYKTSIDYDRLENQPKKFLADFAPRLLAAMQNLSADHSRALFGILGQMIAEKQIMMFSLDPELEGFAERYGLAGEIKKTDRDYLAIFHSNVGGGKTDQNIHTQVQKTVTFDEFGHAVVNLKITRANHGYDEKSFPRNLDFMRVPVPLGSRLISSQGFDEMVLPLSVRPGARSDQDLAFWDIQIQKDESTGMYVGYESGYTSFMNWLSLDPGMSRTVEITYELPRVFQSYSLLLQKQPGAPPFEFSLKLEGTGALSYFEPSDGERDSSGLQFTEVVDSDRVFGFVLK